MGLGRFFRFFILYQFGKTPWMGDQPVARPLSTHRTTQTQNKGTQTPMPRVGFEPMIPVFERAKTGSCIRPRDHCGRLPIGFYEYELPSRLFYDDLLISLFNLIEYM
jgi:hypothetical protein